jgi:hypothetical protein
MFYPDSLYWRHISNLVLLVRASGGRNPQNLGSAESKSFVIFSEIRANQIRIRIPNLKKRFAVV